MAKQRLTKKSGPSRRPKKKSRTICEYSIHESLRKVFIKISDYKGISNEDRFAKIFSGDFPRPHWFSGFRRATKHEDFNEGTDFFIQTKNYGDIRFDVKSSFIHYQRQKEFQKDRDVFVWGIVMKPHISDEEIRQTVFSKCEIHINHLKREVRLGHLPARTA
ncbi:MAG: hypothetical protein WCJ74_02280 [bacterium]